MLCQALNKKVFVGLSGGVDSSVSAALLKEAGYDATGVFIKVWRPLDEASGELLFQCGWKDDRLDAMRVCAKLGIPFVELNLEKEYKKEVVDYMLREYKTGRTPNPDVFCNRFIKFGAFYEFARRRGADFIATGHYARIEKNRESRAESRDRKGSASGLASRFSLLASTDTKKDQSYFLWQIREEQLPHILFPVGGMKKPKVRKLAKKFGLITADKKDSQGLCFVGKVDMKEFLKHYIKPRKGKVLDEKGVVLAEHDGAEFYTIGERIGFAAPSFPPLKRGDRGGWFVISKNMAKNILTVSHKSPAGDLDGAVREVEIKNCNWLVEPNAEKRYTARVRYRQPLQKCRLVFPRRSAFSPRLVRVRFEVAQNAAPGQSLVLYDGNICLGGGIIS